MRKLLHIIAMIFAGTHHTGTSPEYQEPAYQPSARERAYHIWEIVIIYAFLIFVALKLYFMPGT